MALVATYSVALPPQKLEFGNSTKEEFLKNESENVYTSGMLMFLDVEKSLKAIQSRFLSESLILQGLTEEFSNIEHMLKQERCQFQVDIQNAVNNGNRDNFLTLNKVRLKLLLESFVWGKRLHSLGSFVFSAPDSRVSTKSCMGTAQVEDGLSQKYREQDGSLSSSAVEDITQPANQKACDKSPFRSLLNIANDEASIWTPFSEIQQEYLKDLLRGYVPKLKSISSLAPGTTACKVITDEASRLHIPLGTEDFIVSDYEDDFSSIISCALDLLNDLPIPTQDLDDDAREKQGIDNEACKNAHALLLMFCMNSPYWSSSGSLESSHFSSFNGLELLDSLVSLGIDHAEISMGIGKSHGKPKYSVVCPCASQFRHLRNQCCPSEVDYIASLSRCRNWDCKGGKSKSFFAKTLDDRFVIKEIKKTEFESLMKFAPNYFDHMNQGNELEKETCLVKILGIYQVTIRQPKNGKETRHDLMVMENLLFGRNISQVYDLKGALHSRFTSSCNGVGGVLLDQNFANNMKASPLYVSSQSKRNLQHALWNDTTFLKSINVMDYSLLVGVDEDKHELVCGIIDYMRQYTWDKHLESLAKSSLLVPTNQLPTVICPKLYEKRFREFMDTHFLIAPDHFGMEDNGFPA